MWDVWDSSHQYKNPSQILGTDWLFANYSDVFYVSRGEIFSIADKNPTILYGKCCFPYFFIFLAISEYFYGFHMCLGELFDSFGEITSRCVVLLLYDMFCLPETSIRIECYKKIPISSDISGNGELSCMWIYDTIHVWVLGWRIDATG